ncbi:MAG: putative glycosyltransferase [Actinomycetospora sp.]|jgi:glycosyltransferase involved in cell wall biosynthesis|nr:putative glycosyltransferase [Actinomycetospora sp.]
MSDPAVTREVSSVDRPAVSFLCTAYRTEQYLPATIRSVLDQTRTDWELVVVDNGMSDAIRDIVEEHADPRIVLVRQENRGMEGGVQAAAAAASGRYVAVLNSDDQITPRYTERMVALLDENPGVDVVDCDAYVVDGRTGTHRRRTFRRALGYRSTPSFSHRLTLADVVDGTAIYYTAIMRREAWDRVGGFVDGAGLADTAMWMRLLGAGADIRQIPDPLCRYLHRNDSLSRSPESAARFQAEQERAFIAGAAGSDDPAVLEALARRLRSLRYHEALRRARSALLEGDAVAARAAADSAVSNSTKARTRARALAVAAAVRVAPHVLTAAWPLKQRVTRRVTEIAGKVAAARRGDA